MSKGDKHEKKKIYIWRDSLGFFALSGVEKFVVTTNDEFM